LVEEHVERRRKQEARGVVVQADDRRPREAGVVGPKARASFRESRPARRSFVPR
jgi:hypothetical protein